MKRILASALVGIFPMMALAQSATYVNNWFRIVQTWVGYAVPLIISLSVAWFLWNVFQYAVKDSEEDKAKARSQMIWGVIGITVMVSVWGLVQLLQSVFQVGGNSAQGVSIPTF